MFFKTEQKIQDNLKQKRLTEKWEFKDTVQKKIKICPLKKTSIFCPESIIGLSPNNCPKPSILNFAKI